MKFKLVEESQLPLEGFFWIIEDEVVGYTEQVNKYGYELKQSKTHEELWDSIKPNGCDKGFDYYPRGRVMVDQNYDSDGKFTHFSAMVFLDPCINNKRDKVTDYYNLSQIEKRHNIFWMVNLKERSGINHYSCFMCRGEKDK